MKYVIYTRKSTEDEDRQILSIEAQLTELREFAAKENLEIVASIQESKTAKEPGIKNIGSNHIVLRERKF
ncbi:MAG TPA: recombinase family protein [Candidatus Paceibacterota bacterium]